MRFEDLSWMDVEAYLQTDDRLMLILGACEQHAYLSLTTDVRIPQALADAASQSSGVLCAPPLNFGCSPYFLAYPGTLSLRPETLMALVGDVVESLYGQGFRRLLVLNGHGGNGPARSRLYELAAAHPDLQLRWYEWWLSHSVEEVALRHHLKPAHANWLEAFPFTQVGPLPAGDKVPPEVPGLLSPARFRQLNGDGSFGGPYSASPEVMAEVFEACMGDVLHLLRFA
jgi:creatinine amidohydrolase